jgi:hypothetical protein
MQLNTRARHFPIISSLYSIIDLFGKRMPSKEIKQSPSEAIKMPNKVTSGPPVSADLTAKSGIAKTPTPIIVLKIMIAA